MSTYMPQQLDPELDPITAARLYAQTLRKNANARMPESEKGQMMGKYYIGGNPGGDLIESIGGSLLDAYMGRKQSELGTQREQDYQNLMGQRPTADETLSMQGPTEDGGVLPGSFRQAKSGDRQVREMEDWGAKLSQSRDPRAQTLGSQLLTKSLARPYALQDQEREDADNAATLKLLKSRSEAAIELTGNELPEQQGKGMKGNVAELRKLIETVPDLVERQNATDQLNRQIAAAPRKPVALPQSVELSLMPGKGVKAAAGLLAKEEAQAAGDRRLLNIVQPHQAAMQDTKLAAQVDRDRVKAANALEVAKTRAGASNIPEHEAALLKAVDEGRLDPMKITSRNRAFLGASANNNPTMDFNDVSAVANANRLLESEYSPKGISGRSYRSINTTINHLGTLEKLGEGLKNNDVRVLNWVGNQFGKQFGDNPQTNFDAAKQVIAAEIMKSIVPGGGGVTERMELAKQVEAASSPEQLTGFIKVAKELMAGQLQSLEQTYAQGDEAKLARLRQRLSPEAKEALVAKETPKAAPGAPTTPLAKSTERAEAIKWANDPKNANDPRLAGVKKKLGIP